jgi:hypothetical protein
VHLLKANNSFEIVLRTNCENKNHLKMQMVPFEVIKQSILKKTYYLIKI